MSSTIPLNHREMEIKDTAAKFIGFQYSGVNLIEEVNSLNPNLVIDVGCGANYFRGKIKNLIGFDKDTHPNLDFQCSISDMNIEPNSVDVALALGTFQYSTREQVFNDVSTIVNWVKPGGYIVVRLNPFVSETVSMHSKYRWSQEWFDHVSNILGLKVAKGIYIDHNVLFKEIKRIVWWWQKQ